MNLDNLLILWFDDDDERSTSAKSLEEYLGRHGETKKVVVDFKELKQKDVMDVLRQEFLNHKDRAPDLIILDQIFSDVVGDIQKGSSIVEIVRENWQDRPIVGVTGADKYDGIDIHRKRLFDELFFIDEPTNDIYEEIWALLKGYNLLSHTEISGLDDIPKIIELLNCPDEDKDLIKSLLPREILTGNMHTLNIANWVRNELIHYPGVLLDRKWVTNIIGLNETGFSKVEDLFLPSLYSGIFDNELRKRWWKNKVVEIAFLKSHDSSSHLSWHAGHSLPNISESDHSVCVECLKKFPESMGFVDEELNRGLDKFSDCKPMHVKCSTHDERFSDRPYFEEIRCLDGD